MCYNMAEGCVHMKRIILVGVCILAIIASILLSKFNQKTENYEIGEDFKINMKEMSYCSNEIFEYDERDGETIYLLCLSEIKIEDSKREVTFYDYLDQKNNSLEDTIEKITSKLKAVESNADGLWTLYMDTDKNISDGSLSLIKCNGEDNKDIYFSKENLNTTTIESLGLCQNKQVIEEKPELYLNISAKKDCTEDPAIYLEKDGKKVFTSCIDSIDVEEKDNPSKTLNNYLNEDILRLDNILEHLELSSSLNDGGTNIYKSKDQNEFSNIGMTIVKCHRMQADGNFNDDIYIGPMDLEYREDFCVDKEILPE